MGEQDVKCTPHTLFRLSERQRKIFTCEQLKLIVLYQAPLKAGIQRNGNYALYYKQEEKPSLTKIIASVKPTEITLITFYILDSKEVPRG